MSGCGTLAVHHPSKLGHAGSIPVARSKCLSGFHHSKSDPALRRPVRDRRNMWAISSVGRAVGLQPTGRRFEPCIVHHNFGRVAQWFKSILVHQFANERTGKPSLVSWYSAPRRRQIAAVSQFVLVYKIVKTDSEWPGDSRYGPLNCFRCKVRNGKGVLVEGRSELR